MSTIRADNFGNRAGTSQIPADTLTNGTAKCWINFNGVGTITNRNSFNVSSLVDNGIGSYAVNMTTAASNGNFSIVASNFPTVTSYEFMGTGTNTTSQFLLFCTSITGAGVPSRQDPSSAYAHLMCGP